MRPNDHRRPDEYAQHVPNTPTADLHPDHVDTGGAEFYGSPHAEGTDAAVIYYQGVVGRLNHEGDFGGVQRMRKDAPQTEHTWAPLHRPWQYQPLITPNGTEGSADLVGFNGAAVIVHNYTPQFAYLPDLRMWVDPFRINLILRVPAALSLARVQWFAPPGFTQPAALTGATLVSLWTEEPLAPDAGATILGHP